MRSYSHKCMRKIYRKKKTNHGRKSFLIIVPAALFVIFFVSSSVMRVFFKKSELEQSVSHIEQEIGQLENTNEELRRLIEYLKTPDYARTQARSKLGMHLPGEEVIVITGSAVSTPSLPRQGISEWEEQNSNLERWWKYFFYEE